jgi:hypothetical protein
MALTWLPLTSQGYMVGDYISTSFNAAGLAYPVIMVATPPSGGMFNEAAYTVASGLTVIAAGSGTPATQSGASSVGSVSQTTKIR